MTIFCNCKTWGAWTEHYFIHSILRLWCDNKLQAEVEVEESCPANGQRSRNIHCSRSSGNISECKACQNAEHVVKKRKDSDSDTCKRAHTSVRYTWGNSEGLSSVTGRTWSVRCIHVLSPRTVGGVYPWPVCLRRKVKKKILKTKKKMYTKFVSMDRVHCHCHYHSCSLTFSCFAYNIDKLEPWHPYSGRSIRQK